MKKFDVAVRYVDAEVDQETTVDENVLQFVLKRLEVGDRAVIERVE